MPLLLLLLLALTVNPQAGPIMWTRAQVAAILQVNISTVDRWIAAGEMDSVLISRTRRVPDAALQDWVARRLKPAADNARKPGRPKRKAVA